MSQDEIAVVGAGPGGLASAILLRSKGHGVRVYEAREEVGGRTARIRKDGFTFDTGPTFFLMPYVLEEIFAAGGSSLHKHVELTRLDPMYRLIVGSDSGEPATIDTTQDLDAMAERLRAIDPHDADAFHDFILHNRAKLERMEPVLRSAQTSIFSPVSLRNAALLPKLHPMSSVSDLLEKRFRSPVSRLALSFQSKYLGMSPKDCPALFTILPFIEYEYGVWHPTGGCNALMHAMADLARSMGVAVETGSPVERLVFNPDNSLRGLIVHGEERAHADAVLNADATHALKQMVPNELRARAMPRFTDNRIDQMRYSCSTYMLYLGVRGGVDLPHHTIYISSKYNENLDDITHGGKLSQDPSVYVCNPSPIDPTMAPRGCSSLYVLMPTPNLKLGRNGVCTESGEHMTWEDADAVARSAVVEQLSRRLGIEDLGSRIVVEQRCTPSDWARSGINHGATFNLAHNLSQMLYRRVPHSVEGLPGVHFVGGATHPGSGLPVIFLSAHIAADGVHAKRARAGEPALV